MTLLAERVLIDRRFLRSVHLEKDLDQLSLIEDYVLTANGQEILSRITENLLRGPSNRAWSLTGPYGAGKSAFGVFLAALFGDAEKESTEAAMRKMALVNPKLRTRFRLLRGAAAKNRCLRVVVSGSPEPLGWKLLEGLKRGAGSFWNQPGRKPQVLTDLSLYLPNCSRNVIPASDVLSFYERTIQAAGRGSGSGAVVLIDELGKNLEYAIQSGNTADVFLLQALAESFSRSEVIPCGLICFLHQSFETYAQGASQEIQNEWKKVHGRFEDTAFLESDDQILTLLATAISRQDDGMEPALSRWAKRHTKKLVDLGLNFSEKTMAHWARSCYPLHPLSFLVLPQICRRYGQNERSAFSFLATLEPKSFQEFLRTTHFRKSRPPSFGLWHLYDHFAQSYFSMLAGHADARKWAEVQSAIDRLGDAPAHKVNLLKTIGLLNLAGIRQNLRAFQDLLFYAFEDVAIESEKIGSYLDELLAQSFVTYRRFSDEYRVWQGSDLDIEAYLEENRQSLSSSSLAEVLNQDTQSAPLVARRHSAEKGTLRYFSIQYVGPESLEENLALQQEREDGKVLVSIAKTCESVEYVKETASGTVTPNVLFGVVKPSSSLLRTAGDLHLLRRASRRKPELQNDPVAQREIKDRVFALRQLLSEELGDIYSGSDVATWLWKGSEKRFQSRDEFTAFLSKVCDLVFPHTPKIWNELINRRNLSSTSAAARTKLIGLMIDCGELETLGITGYPPERSMYESLLKATGLHRKSEELDAWEFREPHDDFDPGFGAAWNRLRSLLQESEAHAVNVARIYETLKSPPFGMLEGPIPVILCGFLLSCESDVAVYERGTFVPVLSREMMERLMKTPENFSVQLYRSSGLRSLVLQKYFKIIAGKERQEVQILDVVRPLFRFVKQLPKYTLLTEQLSGSTLRVRAVLLTSRSPAKLLFEDLPQALGFEPFRPEDGDPDTADAFLSSLMKSLRELQGAYDALLQRLVQCLISSFNLSRSQEADARSELRSRSSALLNYTVDPKLRSFLVRAGVADLDFVPWIESVATLLSKKPPTSWHDQDVASFELNLSIVAKRFKNVEGLRLSTEHYQNSNTESSIAYRVSLTKRAGTKISDSEEVVFVDHAPPAGFQQLLADFGDQLGAFDRRTKLALLASLMDGVLEANQEQPDAKRGTDE